MRGRLAKALILVALAFSTQGAAAQAPAFPARPVTLIVPFPAGGATDVTMRALAATTEKHLGQSIMIENRSGANGALAPVQMAATAAPDGYTVALITRNVFRFPFMTRTSFDPATDLTYLIGVSGYTFGVVVRSDAPWTTFQDFVADAKTHPGKINYGTTGAGSSQHIVMEQIRKQHGAAWTHIPFKGDADLSNALLGGHIHAIAGSTAWAPLVNAGKFRLLVTFGSTRTANWPNIPILRDAGFAMATDSPIGLTAPKGLDPKVVTTLHDAFKKGMDEPAFRATLAKLDMEPWYRSSEDFRAYALSDIPEQKRVVEEFSLKQD
jgi:tripartite-type tricarboxylate transporter receptor subunit TctC